MLSVRRGRFRQAVSSRNCFAQSVDLILQVAASGFLLGEFVCFAIGSERALELARGVLVHDDGPAAGYSYRPNEERLQSGIAIRKQLRIADPQAFETYLLIGGSGGYPAVVDQTTANLSGGYTGNSTNIKLSNVNNGGTLSGTGTNTASYADAGAGLVVGWLLAKSARVVPQWERMIVLRLGKYASTADPGTVDVVTVPPGGSLVLVAIHRVAPSSGRPNSVLLPYCAVPPAVATCVSSE